jgi:hypothetical protein
VSKLAAKDQEKTTTLALPFNIQAKLQNRPRFSKVAQFSSYIKTPSLLIPRYIVITKPHAMKTYCGSGGTAPGIL